MKALSEETITAIYLRFKTLLRKVKKLFNQARARKMIQSIYMHRQREQQLRAFGRKGNFSQDANWQLYVLDAFIDFVLASGEASECGGGGEVKDYNPPNTKRDENIKTAKSKWIEFSSRRAIKRKNVVSRGGYWKTWNIFSLQPSGFSQGSLAHFLLRALSRKWLLISIDTYKADGNLLPPKALIKFNGWKIFKYLKRRSEMHASTLKSDRSYRSFSEDDTKKNLIMSGSTADWIRPDEVSFVCDH